jgi:hypothetical protein
MVRIAFSSLSIHDWSRNQDTYSASHKEGLLLQLQAAIGTSSGTKMRQAERARIAVGGSLLASEPRQSSRRGAGNRSHL